jgi:hypothetical protein
MQRLRRQLFRSILMVSLLWLALLLPTLHFHPFLEHEHGDHESHQHGVVHADFLAAGVPHGHAEAADNHDVADHPTTSYQINFWTLISRCDPFLLDVAQTHPIFFFGEPHILRPSICGGTPEPNHPPPITQFYRSLRSPRSPPHSV